MREVFYHGVCLLALLLVLGMDDEVLVLGPDADFVRLELTHIEADAEQSRSFSGVIEHAV